MNQISFPIDKMCHVTHYQQAMQILEGCMTFRPAVKLARDNYSLEYNGDEMFTQLSSDRAMFPGYLTWFAAKPPDGLGTLAIEQLRQQYGDIDGVLSAKLKTDSSPYGTVSLTTPMSSLLNAYKSGFPNSDSLKLIFKRAGTLRYNNEICYVIVVTVDDTVFADVPTIEHPMEEILDLPFIKFERSKTNSMWCSWEQTVFAFHYPHTYQALQLPPSEVDILPVKHHCFDQNLRIYGSRYKPPRCHSANFRSDHLCPDLVDFRKQRGIFSGLDPLHDIKRMIEEQNVAEYQKKILEKFQIEDETKHNK